MLALCVMMSVVVPSCRFTPSSASITRMPGLGIERAGRLVAEQHLGPLGDGARDGDTLLLAAGELRRKMMHAAFQADERKRFVRAHRVIGNLRHQRDVLVGGEARDQIIELEHEPDMLRRYAVRPRSSEPGQLQVLEEQPAAARHDRGRP